MPGGGANAVVDDKPVVFAEVAAYLELNVGEESRATIMQLLAKPPPADDGEVDLSQEVQLSSAQVKHFEERVSELSRESDAARAELVDIEGLLGIAESELKDARERHIAATDALAANARSYSGAGQPQVPGPVQTAVQRLEKRDVGAANIGSAPPAKRSASPGGERSLAELAGVGAQMPVPANTPSVGSDGTAATVDPAELPRTEGDVQMSS